MLLFAGVRQFSRGSYTQWEIAHGQLQTVKGWIGSLTEIGLMLLALGIVAALLVGPNTPFVGNVLGNITAMVKDLGSNGLVGLIALGIVLWLFSNRKVASRTNRSTIDAKASADRLTAGTSPNKLDGVPLPHPIPHATCRDCR